MKNYISAKVSCPVGSQSTIDENYFNCPNAFTKDYSILCKETDAICPVPKAIQAIRNVSNITKAEIEKELNKVKVVLPFPFGRERMFDDFVKEGFIEKYDKKLVNKDNTLKVIESEGYRKSLWSSKREIIR